MRVALKALPAGLGVLLWTAQASAQKTAVEAPPKTEARAHELARVLNPADYPSAFYLGAQAEFVLPQTSTAGVSSLLIGYDFGALHLDLSAGVGLGGDTLNDEPATELYGAVVRVGLPVHRGVRADFALQGGGGIVVLDPPGGSPDLVGEVGAGGRFRVFMTPNVAVIATLGLIALFRGENSSYVVGARPLGAAAVAYFFR